MTPIERGVFEKMIDNILKDVPAMTKTFRQYRVPLMIRNDADFMLGQVIGYLMASLVAIVGTGGKAITAEDIQEGWDTISQRSKEIREAVFNAG